MCLSLWGDAHIFVYHRFGDDKHASTNTSIDILTRHFEYFKKHNYKVVTLSKLNRALKNGEKIPDSWVVLSIDDSYKSFYENALEVFKKYNYPFSLFVYIEATEKHYGDFMSWEQIKEASKYGEIALHSYAHPHLVSLSKDEVTADTKKAYDIFKSKMGFAPKYYAYPYGEYTYKTKEALKEFDFDLILNQNAGAVNLKSDPYDLDRTALTGDVNLKPKLAIKALNAKWFEPLIYPANGNLKRIHAKIAPSITHVEYYVSGYGWQDAKVIDGDINITTDKKLKFSRNRLFLKNGNFQSSIILVKN
jgi:peptidoglycan/xylan/chitin deacetylase (PgdA/CDA1 family)